MPGKTCSMKSAECSHSDFRSAFTSQFCSHNCNHNSLHQANFRTFRINLWFIRTTALKQINRLTSVHCKPQDNCNQTKQSFDITANKRFIVWLQAAGAANIFTTYMFIVHLHSDVEAAGTADAIQLSHTGIAPSDLPAACKRGFAFG